MLYQADCIYNAATIMVHGSPSVTGDAVISPSVCQVEKTADEGFQEGRQAGPVFNKADRIQNSETIMEHDAPSATSEATTPPAVSAEHTVSGSRLTMARPSPPADGVIVFKVFCEVSVYLFVWFYNCPSPAMVIRVKIRYGCGCDVTSRTCVRVFGPIE
jgi:hypothetical protein